MHIGQGATFSNMVSLLAGVAAIPSLLMMVACLRHWLREYAGLGKSLNTFAVSFGIVAVYYAILVLWFWHVIPVAAASKQCKTSFPEASRERLRELESPFPAAGNFGRWPGNPGIRLKSCGVLKQKRVF